MATLRVLLWYWYSTDTPFGVRLGLRILKESEMRQELDVDDVLGALTEASSVLAQFSYFLRQRERRYLGSQEPEFVQTVQRLISPQAISNVSQITSLYSEKVKPVLKNPPTEWVKLMQDASDVGVAVRHLKALVKATNADKQSFNAVSGIYRFGEWIELIIYDEADVNYRIVERLEKCLNRAKRPARRTGDVESSKQIAELENLIKTREKGFKAPRDSITHVVNYAQSGLVEEERIWELICLFENPISPASVLTRTIEENVDGYMTLIHSEAMQTVELLIDFYPKLKMLLNKQFPE